MLTRPEFTRPRPRPKLTRPRPRPEARSSQIHEAEAEASIHEAEALTHEAKNEAFLQFFATFFAFCCDIFASHMGLNYFGYSPLLKLNLVTLVTQMMVVSPLSLNLDPFEETLNPPPFEIHHIQFATVDFLAPGARHK